MAKEKPISILKASILLGVSHTAVQKAVDAGRLTQSVVMVNKKPKILASRVVDEWLANTNGVRMDANGGNSMAQRAEKIKKTIKAVAPKPQREPKPKPIPAEPVDDEEEEETGEDDAEPGKKRGSTLNDARTMREVFAAKREKIEYEKINGELVYVQAVRDNAFKIARAVREGLLNIPERMATTLAAESNAHAIHTLLTDEINKVLEELSHANGRI